MNERQIAAEEMKTRIIELLRNKADDIQDRFFIASNILTQCINEINRMKVEEPVA